MLDELKMTGNGAVVGARVSGCSGEGTRLGLTAGTRDRMTGLQRPAVIDLHMQNRQTLLSLAQIFRWTRPIWNVGLSMNCDLQGTRVEGMEIPTK